MSILPSIVLSSKQTDLFLIRNPEILGTLRWLEMLIAPGSSGLLVEIITPPVTCSDIFLTMSQYDGPAPTTNTFCHEVSSSVFIAHDLEGRWKFMLST